MPTLIPVRPHQPVRPGEILQEELEARGWTQADLAQILGRPLQAVNEIIVGRKAITAETAVALSHALDAPAEFWLRLDALYRLDLLQGRRQVSEEDINRRARVYSAAPVKELLRRRWLTIADPQDPAQLEEAVCQFFGTRSIDEKPALPFAARRGHPETPQTSSFLAWVAQARRCAERDDLGSVRWSGERMGDRSLVSAAERAIAELPKLSTLGDGAAQACMRVRQLGIRVVFVPHLPGTRVDGAAFWLDDDSPVVAISLRYDRIDWFWFTFMHELAHIVSGHARDAVRVDDALVGKDAQPAAEKTGEEKLADQLASDWLIPKAPLHDFVKQTKPYFSRTAILTFAESVGVHPGIIVGRLQHDGDLSYTHLRNLLDRAKPQLQAFVSAED